MKRNPWPYAISGFIVIFVVTVIGFGIYSTTLDYHLVSPDYYQDQLQFQTQIDQRKRAEALSERPTWGQDANSGNLVIRFPLDGLPQAGAITLFRPSDPDLDRTLPLVLGEDGRQVVERATLAPGLWKVKLTWVQQGDTYYLEDLLSLE